jgi:hypothetical protein
VRNIESLLSISCALIITSKAFEMTLSSPGVTTASPKLATNETGPDRHAGEDFWADLEPLQLTDEA